MSAGVWSNSIGDPWHRSPRGPNRYSLLSTSKLWKDMVTGQKLNSRLIYFNRSMLLCYMNPSYQHMLIQLLLHHVLVFLVTPSCSLHRISLIPNIELCSARSIARERWYRLISGRLNPSESLAGVNSSGFRIFLQRDIASLLHDNSSGLLKPTRI